VIKLPVGWCAVLTDLEHELQGHRVHHATDPVHSECEGGAAGCEESRREAEMRYRAALWGCTGAERRAKVETARH
jgi:hypothetical protein